MNVYLSFHTFLENIFSAGKKPEFELHMNWKDNQSVKLTKIVHAQCACIAEKLHAQIKTTCTGACVHLGKLNTGHNCAHKNETRNDTSKFLHNCCVHVMISVPFIYPFPLPCYLSCMKWLFSSHAFIGFLSVNQKYCKLGYFIWRETSGHQTNLQSCVLNISLLSALIRQD